MHKPCTIQPRLGLVNRDDFESYFGGYWRTISANKSMQWRELSPLINQAKPMEIIYGQPMTETSMEIYGFVRGKEAALRRPQRACPVCMKYHFHSALFELEWLTLCPIHKCAITSSCQQCQQKWPTLHEFYKRTCPSCSKATTLYGGSGRIRKTPNTSALKKLWNIIQVVPRVPGLYSNKLTPTLHNQPHTLLLTSKTFGDYLQYYLKKSNRPSEAMFVAQLMGKFFSLKTRSDRLQPVSPRDDYDTTHIYTEYLSKARFKVFTKIAHWILKQFPNENTVPMFLPFATNNQEINPFSFALNIWLLHVASYPYPYRTQLSTKQYRYLGELSHFDFPTITAWTHWQTQDGNLSRLPKAFIIWLYSLDLEACFAEIFLRIHMISWNERSASKATLAESYANSLQQLNTHKDCLAFIDDKKIYYATDPTCILDYLEKHVVERTVLKMTLDNDSNPNDILSLSSDINTWTKYNKYEYQAQYAMGQNIRLRDIERWKETAATNFKRHANNHPQTELF